MSLHYPERATTLFFHFAKKQLVDIIIKNIFIEIHNKKQILQNYI